MFVAALADELTIIVVAGLLALATAFVFWLKARGHSQGANLVDRVKTWWIKRQTPMCGHGPTREAIRISLIL